MDSNLAWEPLAWRAPTGAQVQAPRAGLLPQQAVRRPPGAVLRELPGVLSRELEKSDDARAAQEPSPVVLLPQAFAQGPQDLPGAQQAWLQSEQPQVQLWALPREEL
ncbi:MAG TPA: hypothetical protein VKT71_04165 [Candidatus Acidoferrales bacterium]|nr:hypothetical protein [Candidatus Acidoferrales bacterium]